MRHLIRYVRKTDYGASLEPTPYEHVTTYNNFYEFGTDMKDPEKHAGKLKTRTWNIAVEGECDKPAVFLLCLLPLVRFIRNGIHQNLGANPVEAIRLFNGDWALRFLIITLAVTPVRRLDRWNAVHRLRRMLGLYAFFYACLHLVSYVSLDQQFLVDLIVEDILDRPHITMGVLGFLLIVPLAATSTRGTVRRLGARRWQRLHRIVYATAIAGVVHYWWLVKSDATEPLIYAICLAAAGDAIVPGDCPSVTLRCCNFGRGQSEARKLRHRSN